MFKVLIIIFIFPLFVFGQSVSSLKKEEQTKIYSQAITEYIRSMNTIDLLNFDTLFVGPDEYLHDVQLPKEILKTKIARLTQEEGDRKAEYRKTFVFANVIATISKDHAEFIFVTFITEKALGKAAWLPKHNYVVDLNYDPKTKEYKFEKQRFEHKYSNKYTKKQK
jgi:hypothetical protein